ncbi:glycosyltransferase [Vibrio ostreicida]|uniref:Glycosyltransferase n=1 Tax=Vibrio ostreicida TaxID=526588 RepID=A0ABT8BW31_9VIBR|nr:glycosyltransferase [Vibrio ostreicida]MDN3608466.1 glycosyltransferase [Vibrio ostreicida]MDN3611221.1 glycosyltransferase [Vibrio ostreicida]NPD10288.1 glycosyltransferase [Vibrio ostreicida]
MAPKVCVLLAAYNGEQFLEEQLESILLQLDVSVDVYVSLDLSIDGSFDIISKYVGKANVYLLPYGASFGSAGQNFFNLLINVEFNNYDYIAFSDQDDIWLPHKLHYSIELMLAKNAYGYSGSVSAFWEDGRQSLIKKDYAQSEFDYLFESAGPGCTFVLNQILACEIQSFLISNKDNISQLWLHDWFCYSFSRDRKYKWVIGSEPLVLYRQHDNNAVGANNGIRASINRAAMVLNGQALEKVKSQSQFLEQHENPIQLIRSGSPADFLRLSLIGHKCRRRTRDKVIFTVAMLLLSVRRFLGRD